MPETIQVVLIIMEQVTPSIQDHEEVSTITTVEAPEPMFQKGTYGNSKNEKPLATLSAEGLLVIFLGWLPNMVSFYLESLSPRQGK